MTTQYANASYQEVIDLHTESDTVSVVGIHTPNSDTPVKMLHGFWEQFRKFKYNGCSISLVPAARLPADPLQVSYGAGATTIDPRDMLNPILFHGCHGNDMGVILNTMYNDSGATTDEVTRQFSDSTDQNIFPAGNVIGNAYIESLYYRALTDKTWLKAHPQKGFRKSGLHPMIYSLATTVQMSSNADGSNSYLYRPRGLLHDDSSGVATGQANNVAGIDANALFHVGNGFDLPAFDSNTRIESLSTINPRAMASILTPRLQKLGWLDTKNTIGARTSVTSDRLTGADTDDAAVAKMWSDADAQLGYATVPKVFMGMIMLPPAYKTEQYFRLVINHSFSFAKFRGASMQYDNVGMLANNLTAYNFNDEPDKKHDPDEEMVKDDEEQ